MARTFWLAVFATPLGLAGVAGYGLLRVGLEADVYRERLEQTSRDYAALREQYDQAIRRTAVTELVVDGDRLSVAIRDATGAARVIETPFDPSHEIYVDYAVLDGRLWIRRVFDDRTPPGEGVLVDPGLAHVDWDARGDAYGKATYRSLGPGRWVVSVSGDGSLGLTRVPDGAPTELAPPPPVRDYEPIEDARDDALRELGFVEVMRALGRRVGVLGGGNPS
jgi:hypothetical protein